MLLSEILKSSPDENVENIINEEEFDRFSRTTSVSEGRLCVFAASQNYVHTIPENAVMVITTQEIAPSVYANHVRGGGYVFRETRKLHFSEHL